MQLRRLWLIWGQGTGSDHWQSEFPHKVEVLEKLSGKIIFQLFLILVNNCFNWILYIFISRGTYLAFRVGKPVVKGTETIKKSEHYD